MRLFHEIAIFQTVKSQVIISLFETVRLSVSISPRNLYNSLNSIKEKNSRMSTPRTFFFRIFTSVSDHHISRSEYAGLAITGSLSSFQSLFSNSV